MLDGDAGRDDQEPLGEAPISRARNLVDDLPSDQHRHHYRLARTGCHLERYTREAIVVGRILGIDACSVVRVAVPASNLGEVDRGLGGLPLAEEHRLFSLRRHGSPVLQELASDGSDARVLPCPPAIDLETDVVDKAVLLAALTCRVEVEGRLPLALLAGRDRDEGFGRPPPLEGRARRAV